MIGCTQNRIQQKECQFSKHRRSSEWKRELKWREAQQNAIIAMNLLNNGQKWQRDEQKRKWWKKRTKWINKAKNNRKYSENTWWKQPRLSQKVAAELAFVSTHEFSFSLFKWQHLVYILTWNRFSRIFFLLKTIGESHQIACYGNTRNILQNFFDKKAIKWIITTATVQKREKNMN